MNSLLDTLKDHETWEAFYAYKQERNQLTKEEQKELASFIAEKKYLAFAEPMHFSLPHKKLIAKRESEKKRTVYCYSREETWLLKVLAWQLYAYDACFSDHCYSFRRHRNAASAFHDIRTISDLDQKYVLKLDIHDYFNSIDTALLIRQLEDILQDDSRLFLFLKELLEQDACIFEDQIIEEKRGAMAGVPVSGFFANLYLCGLDRIMEERGIPCFRYSDDIILFFRDEEEMAETYAFIRQYLKERHLVLNEEKQTVSLPHQAWEFLGFRYDHGMIDLSCATIEKMKHKIRRKAKKLYRRRKEKKTDYDAAARAMIRSFDSMFYDFSGHHEFTWIRFYFPMITVTDGLHAIDEYMQQYLRYLYSGRHTKANYRITYEHLKKLGYTPLVAEYYQWRKDNERLKGA